MSTNEQPVTLKNSTPVSSIHGLGNVLTDWALIGLSITAVVLTHFHWAVCIIAFLVIARSQFSIMLEGHEAGHALLLKSPFWNNLVGAFFVFGPTGIPFHKSRKLHWDHHSGLYGINDNEIELHTLKKRDHTHFVMHFVGPLCGGLLVNKVLDLAGLREPTFVDKTTVTDQEKWMDLGSIVMAQLALIGILCSINIWLYPCFWVLPLLTVGSLAHRVKAFCDHAHLLHEDDTYLYCVIPDWWDHLLLTMQQVDHGYHHLFPAVPYYHLNKVFDRKHPHHQVVRRKGYVRFLFTYWNDITKAKKASA